MPRNDERRAEVVALGGVVVDHVEDHLDAGRVQGPHHGLELVDDLLARGRGRVVVVRGQVGDRVVAPVVAQPQVDQAVVVDELVHRHQLDGGDAELGEVVDDWPDGRGRRRCRAAASGTSGWRAGEALDVGLVDDRVGHRVRGGRSSPQSKAGSTTIALGMDGALNRASSMVRSSVAEVVGVERPGPSRPRRRPPWRRGRAAAWPGCSAARCRGRRGRGPGSRSAGPGSTPSR